MPLSVTRTYVKSVDVGIFPETRRAFQVTRCNQCEQAPCTTACPTTAMYRRPDGIVDFDKSICIGCKACMAACPYDAIFINPEDHSAEKCNFCAHRIDMDLEPACVVVCPTEAILVGDLNDPSSRVAQIAKGPVAVRRPEKETHPKLFYRGAHQATLDPLAARRPEGDLFVWSEQQPGADKVVSGHPAGANSSAAALLSYDVAHSIPWDWRVSLYTLTKGIATGAYLVPALLLLTGTLAPDSVLWAWATPILAGLFLAITGALLTWDLEHPWRFYMIFTRPQWQSWLVRGAFIIAGYSIALGLHFLASLSGAARAPGMLVWIGIPLAAMTAIYTAYLLAQAKARDLWQSPLLPFHLLVQSLAAGAAALAPVAAVLEPELVPVLLRILAGASALHLLLVLGEITLPHGTAHAKLAVWEMTSGRYKAYFRASAVLVTLAAVTAVAPSLGLLALPAIIPAVAALLGLLCYEHAYIQGGQAVPLA